MGEKIVTVQPNADGFFTLIDTFKNNKPWEVILQFLKMEKEKWSTTIINNCYQVKFHLIKNQIF